MCRFIEESYDQTFLGFSHQDIAVRWTKSYMRLGYKTSTPMNIQKAYNALATHDIKGPTIVCPIPDNIKVKEKTPTLPALQRLKNYELNEFSVDNNKPFDGMETTFVEPIGCR